MDAWAAGDDVLGFALYWNMLHRFIFDQLSNNIRLSQNALVIPHGLLCKSPEHTLRTLFTHCQLSLSEAMLNKHASDIRARRESSDFATEEQSQTILSVCGETARLFGL